MKHIYSLIVVLILGSSMTLAQNDMSAVTKMSKAEADKIFDKQSPREIAIEFCSGYSHQLKKEGGAIQVDHLTKIINATTRNNACVQKFEIDSSGTAKMLATQAGASQNIGLKMLDNSEISKALLENMKKHNVNTYCSVPMYRSILEHGVTLEYVVKYDNGVVLGTFAITDKECLQ